jgi:predicted membrane channel-forming protein YqfA (hemolysin III family)
LLWLLTYVGTRIRLADGARLAFDPGWLANVTTTSFIQYALTVLLTWAVGALAMAFMQFAGQVTARRFRSFDLGLYAAFGTISLLLMLLILASLLFNIELISVRAA